MRLEFLSDGRTFILVVLAIASLAILAAGFVYPRPFARRLTAIRMAVLILFFIGAISLTLVYPTKAARAPALYVLMDRSISMEQKISPDGPSLAKMAESLRARLSDRAESQGIRLVPLYFSDEASEDPAAVGDRRTTRFSPALSLLLEKAAGSAGTAAPAASRAVLISDGAAADEPMIDPYLTALLSRGISVDVLPLMSEQSLSHPKLFFRVPPPSIATVGESVPIDFGALSAGSVRVTLADGSTELSEQTVPPNVDHSVITFSPKPPGLRVITLSAKNAHGSAQLRFRIKILPRLLFELSGRPNWDARFFLVAASGRPGVTVRGRWTRPLPADQGLSRVAVVFGKAEPVPSDVPEVFWPQSEMSGVDRGIHWLGRVPGAFVTSDLSDPAALRLPPLSARQKLSMDLGWKVIESYTDGTVFMAERADAPATSRSAPTFLVNAEGIWRWRANSMAPAYERFLDRLISWARESTFPPAELFALQEAGQIGMPTELVALFSAPPSSAPVLKIISPGGGAQEVYGTGSTAVRYFFIPKQAGRFRAVLSTAAARPVECAFDVSDAPFDVAHPESRPEILRHIALRTGGRILDKFNETEETLSSHTGAMRDIAGVLDMIHLNSSKPVEQRIPLARHPAFFLLLILLFSVLWTLESRWIR